MRFACDAGQKLGPLFRSELAVIGIAVIAHGSLHRSGGGFTKRQASRKMNNYDHIHLRMRTMDLSDLHIFRSVVQAGGVTRAAERLNRVQSNITTRVRQLEAELGVELFMRAGKRLHLTPSGQVLLDYAERLLDLAAEAREALNDQE